MLNLPTTSHVQPWPNGWAMETTTHDLMWYLALGWLASIGLSFLAGIWFSTSCMPRLRQMAREMGGFHQWWQWVVETQLQEAMDRMNWGDSHCQSPRRSTPTEVTSPTTGGTDKTTWTTGESPIVVIEPKTKESPDKRVPEQRQQSPRRRSRLPRRELMGGTILRQMNEAASPWRGWWKQKMWRKKIGKEQIWAERLNWQRDPMRCRERKRTSREDSSPSTPCKPETQRGGR